MTMMRDEYRSYTNNKMKQIVGTSQFTHGMDLDKLCGIAQYNTKWAYLVNHITNMMRVSWVEQTAPGNNKRCRGAAPQLFECDQQTPESPDEQRYREIYHDC